MRVTLDFGRHFDAVLVDGERLSPRRSQDVFNHSPDGFSWGYHGSGPSQLALALLLAAGVPDDVAVRFHHEFKDDFVARWPESDFEVEIDPLAWVAEMAAL